MTYNLYPAVDNVTYEFPPIIRTVLAKSDELKHTVLPMSQASRNNLSGTDLWNGRLIFNTTTNKINRYDSVAIGWFEIDSSTRTEPITLPGAPTLDLHAATKSYVDTYRPLSGRNRIINGDFSVNQRGFTSLTLPGYGFDRWYHTRSGGSCTHTLVTMPNGEMPESSKFVARFNFTGSTGTNDYIILNQRIEDVRTLSGKTVTVSFWARANTGTVKIGVDFGQYFGTGGSPSAEVNTLAGVTPNLTAGWVRYSFTKTLPTISGKTIGTQNHFLGVYLWLSSGSGYNVRSGISNQSGEVDIWGVQLEEGSVATPYEHKSYAEELRACQRYYQKLVNPPLRGSINSGGTAGRLGMPLSVEMRIKPTPTMSNPGVRIWDGTAIVDATGWTDEYCTTRSIEFDFTHAGTLGANRPAVCYNSGNEGNYRTIELSAEL